MSWKERYDWKVLTDLNSVKVGMLAKLIVGDEMSWSNNCWILGNKDKVYEVSTIPLESEYTNTDKPVHVWVSREDTTIDESNYPTFNDEQTHVECVGNLEWFLFKEEK